MKRKTQRILSLATGIAAGYMQQTQRNEEKARRDSQEKRAQELHDARMAELNEQRDGRIALADAAAPAKVDTGTLVTDDAGSSAFTKDQGAAEVMQDMVATRGAQPTLADATRVNQQVFTDPGKAQQATAEYNSPAATAGRQTRVLQARDPAKAITLTNAALENKQLEQKQADEAMYRRISGFQTPQEIADFMTGYPNDGQGGKLKTTVVQSPDGKTWGFVKETPDGKQVRIPGDYTNDGDGMMKARQTIAGLFGDPKHRLEFYKWDQEQAEKKRHNTAMEKSSQTRADRVGTGGAGSSGGLSREERIKYTTLFTDAGRRLAEANKTLGTLQKNVLFMSRARDPDSEEATQLQNLRNSLAGYEEERTHYQGLLADTQTGPGSSPRPPAKKTAGSTDQPAQPTNQAEYDALPKGARYMRDGQVYIKQ